MAPGRSSSACSSANSRADSSTARPARRDLARGRVERQVGHLQHGCWRGRRWRRRSGAQAGQQLVELEGLDEVVVGAAVQALDLVGQRVARGEHDHRRGVAARAQVAQHREAVALRQAEVEQHGVEALAGQHGIGGAAVAHPVAGHALAAQRLAQALADHRVVFHQQHAHGADDASAGGAVGEAKVKAAARRLCRKPAIARAAGACAPSP